MTSATELPAWFEALKDPRTYPHPVTSIEFTETHISWIVLTGEWVYKLKKPVNFGFVDFSTLEKRVAACHEEIRLNRRTAPQLYDRVIPLTLQSDGARFDGTGTPVEYAVRIRQFDNDQLLDTLLRRHEFVVEQIDDLAREVSRLHASAADDRSPDSPYGSPEAVEQPVLDCFEALRHGELTSAVEGVCDEIATWVEHERSHLTATWIERKRRGRIRECHGDLHLGNIVLFEGRPTLFDCLEFNPRLRWIDVLSDLAFLVMDLQDHQAPQFANRILNVWLEQTGDYAGLSVLRYYQVYRALVRAKVAALRRSQPGLSPAEAAQQLARIHDYCQIAVDYCREAEPQTWCAKSPTAPAIVLMHGLSGSGKSCLAREICGELNAIQIRSDVERKRNESLPQSNTDYYSSRAISRVYDRLMTLTTEIMLSGYSVVIDATFLKREDRLRFARLAAAFRRPFLIVSCQAAPDLLRQRLASRNAAGVDASDATIAVLEQQLQTQEPLNDTELQHTLVVAQPYQDLVELRRQIDAHLRLRIQ